MLLILKERNSEPRVIYSDIKAFRDLFLLLNVRARLSADVFPITQAGLFGVCHNRTISEPLKPTDKLNCTFEVCNEPWPQKINTAISNMLFFRFKDNVEMCERKKLYATPELLDKEICSVTKDDARFVGAMLSDPRQQKFLDSLIAVYENKIKSLEELFYAEEKEKNR